MAHFEWPPDVEECIFNLIRPHVRCGLKKRTWGSLHDELLRAVDERGLNHSFHRFRVQQNEADHTFEPVHLHVIHIDPPSVPQYWQSLNADECASALYEYVPQA